MPPPLKETIIKYFTGTLAAGAIVVLEGIGDYAFLLSNSGAAATLKISFNNGGEQQFPVGTIVRTNEIYNRIVLRNTDTSSTVYEIILGQGYIDYKALVIGNTVTTSPSQSTSGTYAGDVSVSVAAKVFTSTTTKEIILFADPANTDLIYFGFDSGVLSSKKIFGLQPGQIYTFTMYRGDIWAIAGSGTQKLSVSNV